MPNFLLDGGNFDLTSTMAALSFVNYAVWAGVFWLLFYGVRRKHWLQRKVISGFTGWREFRRDILHSTSTCLIFGAVGLLTTLAFRRGWTRVYLNVHDYGWWWFAASIVITLVLHDAYFYWTHRLMHLRLLFPMHRTHHLSRNPSPWTAYAFGPFEACVQAGILPVAVLL